jgi:glycosyltransferase involved in cell wall biosynthesis
MRNDFLFINTHFPPDARYGGIVESGSKLFKHLSAKGNWSACAVSKNPENVSKFIGRGNVSIAKSIFAHGYGLSLSFIFLVYRKIKHSDFVFVNGTITFPTVVSQYLCVLFKIPFGVSLRGTLEPWRIKHKKWKKFLYYKLIVIPLLKKANFIHATCDFEKQCALNHKLSNVVMISNGVEINEFSNFKRNPKEDIFSFLFLSRLDKEKGIDILIEAYKLFCNKYPDSDHELVIVGPDNQGYFKHNFLPLPPNIRYNNGAYGKEKLKFFEEADFFILPSYSENFGNVIAESLACGVPVITTTGVPWAEIVPWDCGFYINPNTGELLEAMEKAFLLSPEKNKEMGVNGKKLINNKYQWHTKAEELNGFISELLKTTL